MTVFLFAEAVVLALKFVVTLFATAGGGALAAGGAACPVGNTGFAFADLLVIGFDPEQNSQAQSPLS